MEIPAFKPSKKFIDDFEAPCLVGKGKDSQIPGLATGYRTEFKKDPPFTVFLRGDKKVTPWQQETLDHLFTRNGLLSAIESGLKTYQAASGFSVCRLIAS